MPRPPLNPYESPRLLEQAPPRPLTELGRRTRWLWSFAALYITTVAATFGLSMTSRGHEPGTVQFALWLVSLGMFLVTPLILGRYLFGRRESSMPMRALLGVIAATAGVHLFLLLLLA